MAKGDFVGNATTRVHRSVAIDPSLKRAPLTSFGNTADNLAILSESVKGKGLFGGTAQVGKNSGKLLKKQ